MLKSLGRLAATFAFVVVAVYGQATWTLAGTTATIHGTVSDEASHPLADVRVSVVSPSYSTSTTTGVNGFYAASGLPVDTYALTFSKSGFQTQSIPGITVNQDQNLAVNVTLQAEAKLLSRVTVRSSVSIVQKSQTADTYTVNDATMTSITGTPQNISETGVLDALPGITTDSSGYPIIRGGEQNEEGYQLEGIDATEPYTGQFINSLSLAGTARLQLSTGGYDVSAGNTNAGVINEVIKRGTYPGEGQATATTHSPNFDHRLAFDYGNATPDNRFSYFYAFNGLRQYRIYGDNKTFIPETVGATGDATGNINVTNLFYRWGNNLNNEVQFFGETGASLFVADYDMPSASILPYATNNPIVQATIGPYVNFIHLFPGQQGVFQNIGYFDNEVNNHSVQKLNYKHQFSSSSFGDLTFFRTDLLEHFQTPWRGGAFGDSFEIDNNANQGISLDYSNQLNQQHQIAFGGETIFTKGYFVLAAPSLAPFTYPDVRHYARLGVIPLVPLNQGSISDPVHRGDAWIKDHWTPTDRLTVTFGVRWDQELIGLSPNAASQNYSFTHDAMGNVVQLPGPPITSDVTKPSQISPRLALSYELNPRDVVRFSYGKNIEFTPVSNIEALASIDPSLASCTIASGCFTPLAGYSSTCVNGRDPANGNAGCNAVTSLYQAAIGDYNSNFFAQYTPVRPQRATNYDASWEHDFGGGYELRISPYFRKGVDYVVANTPVLFTLPGPPPIPVLGSPREQNAGINQNTGVEFEFQRLQRNGLWGFLSATYDNTLANYTSDFFPITNNAALAAGHFFHVSYVAPITATLQLNFDQPNGWHVYADVPYESGYRYGVGKHTFVFLPGPGGTLVPQEVLNTDLAQTATLGAAPGAAYYFTDPTNPGTILNPNIIGSLGTPEGNDPGSLHSPAVALLDLTIARDLGRGANTLQAGATMYNVFGNYTNGVNGPNGLYSNNGFGGYSAISGKNPNVGVEPYHYNIEPTAYLAPSNGAARIIVFYLSAKY